jgi:transcriptional regulator with XRE-family HTH domain
MPGSQIIFPARLKQARKKLALSQAELARLIGVGPGTVGHMETGHQAPTFDILCRLSVALEASLDWLAGLDAPAKRDVPKWLVEIIPDCETLDRHGQAAVVALVKGLCKRG